MPEQRLVSLESPGNPLQKASDASLTPIEPEAAPKPPQPTVAFYHTLLHSRDRAPRLLAAYRFDTLPLYKPSNSEKKDMVEEAALLCVRSLDLKKPFFAVYYDPEDLYGDRGLGFDIELLEDHPKEGSPEFRVTPESSALEVNRYTLLGMPAEHEIEGIEEVKEVLERPVPDSSVALLDDETRAALWSVAELGSDPAFRNLPDEQIIAATATSSIRAGHVRAARRSLADLMGLETGEDIGAFPTETPEGETDSLALHALGSVLSTTFGKDR